MQMLALAKLEADLRLLCERVPVDLKAEFATVKVSLTNLNRNFELLRTQVYWGVATIIGAFLVGVVSLLLKGGLK
jgi:hypothetical protein